MDQPPALKDRSVFFVIAACVATAGATWVVSENVRVKPLTAELVGSNSRLKAALDKEAARTLGGPQAPVITDVLLARIKTDSGHDIEQNIFFKDAEGDARFVSFVVLGTNARQLKVTSHLVSESSEQQSKGAAIKRTWTCGSGPYFVKLRAYITDDAGNISRPRDYTLNC
jgi:hypothetical protein